MHAGRNGPSFFTGAAQGCGVWPPVRAGDSDPQVFLSVHAGRASAHVLVFPTEITLYVPLALGLRPPLGRSHAGFFHGNHALRPSTFGLTSPYGAPTCCFFPWKSRFTSL